MTAPAVPEVELGSLLYVLPSPAGGRLCVKGTGISVRQIAYWYELGWTPEEIAADYAPNLPLSGVYAAIGYFLANRARMESQELEDERLVAHFFEHGDFPEPDVR